MKTYGKIFMNMQLTVCLGCSFFNVLGTTLWQFDMCYLLWQPQSALSSWIKLMDERFVNWENLTKGISLSMIHQMFLLVTDWSKHIMWPNIPWLKLGIFKDITWDMFPHFQTLCSLGKVLFKIQFMTREHFVVVTEEEKYLFVCKVIPDNTQKQKSYVAGR